MLWSQDLVLQSSEQQTETHYQQIEGKLVLLLWDPQKTGKLLAVEMRCESSRFVVLVSVRNFLTCFVCARAYTVCVSVCVYLSLTHLFLLAFALSLSVP